MVPHDNSIPVAILLQLQRFAPTIWLVSSLGGLCVNGYLYFITHKARHALEEQDAPAPRIEKQFQQFERLAMLAALQLAALIYVGAESVFEPKTPHVWSAIVTLIVLVLLPMTLTYFVYRAFRIRIGTSPSTSGK